MSSQAVVIVGGGVSGLATAFYLARHGIRFTIIEKQPRPGGLIRTDEEDGCQLEAGPDSFLAAKPAVAELAAELGIGGEIIGSNDAARRVFVVRRGRLVPLPAGLSMMVPGRLWPALRSPLFSARTKGRLLGERFARPRERGGDFSVGQLVRDHFGAELLEYLADPLLAGVYGGKSGELSAPSVLPRFVGYEQRYGSLIRGVQEEQANAERRTGSLFQSFRGGMQSLTDGLAQTLPNEAFVLGEEVRAVETDGRAWVVQTARRSFEVPHVVLACPASAAARLLAGYGGSLAAELGQIRYSSAILATLLFPSADVSRPLDGFGFLVPARERGTIAAATWINTKFPLRVAAGLIALRVFIVSEEAGRLQNAPDTTVIELARHDLQKYMGITAGPEKSFVYRWPDSMPQYTVGHSARVHRIRQALHSSHGLHLVGNAYDGAGIPDCVRLARQTAEEIARN